MRRFSLMTLVAMLVLAVFASTAHADDYFTKDKSNKPRGEATGDMALVYVFRPATMGAAIRTWAFADDQLIAVSKARGYSFAQVPAGTRLFWGKAENTSGVEVTVEAGKTYYFKVGLRMGLAKARVNMEEISAAEADGLFAKCGYVVPTEAGLQRASEIAAERQDRAAANAAKKKDGD